MAASSRLAIGLIFLPLALMPACGSAGRSPETAAVLLPEDREVAAYRLHPLDESNAAGFRRAFDESKDLVRYVVALSPT